MSWCPATVNQMHSVQQLFILLLGQGLGSLQNGDQTQPQRLWELVGTCSSFAVDRGLQGLDGSAKVPPTSPVKEALYMQSEELCPPGTSSF